MYNVQIRPLCLHAYDHQGRMVWKQISTNAVVLSTRNLVWDGWNIVQEKIANQQSTTNHYVWGLDLSGSLQGAGGVGGLLAEVKDGASYTAAYDANGNVTEYVEDSGTIAAHYEYDPFGNTVVQSGPMADSFTHRFSTKCFDNDTGLGYWGYRWYSPGMGRWLSRDPLGDEATLLAHIEGVKRNEREVFREHSRRPLYIFVGNDPLSSSDLYGLFKWGDLIPPGFGWGDFVPGISGPCIAAIGAMDVITTKMKGGGTHYNLQHCLTSCKIRKACGAGVLNHLAGLLKELFDEYKPKPPFNKDDEWDSTDIQANKDGQGCAGKPEGCECCCKKLGYTNK